MNIFNVEDSLEEFDVQYLEAYNQVVNKRPRCNSGVISERAGSCSSTSQKMTLSSPLLGKPDAPKFATDEVESKTPKLIMPKFRPSKTVGKTSMRPPLKPCVTIESIDTIAKPRKPKHHSTPTSPKNCRNDIDQGTVSSTSCCVGNPFYKPYVSPEVKSMTAIPTVSTFNINPDKDPQFSIFPDAPEKCCKKRKVSSKLDLEFSKDVFSERSASDSSLSSFNSILSLSESQFDDFNFDEFILQEPADIFTNDFKINFDDYTDAFN